MTKSGTKVLNLVLQASDIKNSVKSFQFSKKYVKRLVKISLLNIVYRRIDIPQSEFELKNYENVPYMIFKRKSTNKFIRANHSIGMGIIDAIEKDYLKEISVYIIRKETREPLETYNIKVKYNKEDTKSNQKPAKVKEETIEFLKAFTDLPGKKWKEENVELFIELSYNEDTPREYEPPNFEAAKQTLSSGSNKFVSLGKINTGFHKISAWGRGKNFNESRSSTPAPTLIANENSQTVISDKETPENVKRQNKDDTNPDILTDECETQSKKRKLDKSFLNNTSGEINWETVSIVSSIDYISCLCNWDLPEEYETIRCTKCFGTVHLACHGFISSKDINRDSFTCLICSDAKHIKYDLNMVVKLRVILYGIFINKSIPYELQLASKDERHYILEQLEKFGVRSVTATSIQDINLNGLNSAIEMVFQTEDSQFFK